MLSGEQLLSKLRAISETTRLQVVWLCSETELTLSELQQILGQSQPRLSRHLKILSDAEVIERFEEGSHVYFRAQRQGPDARLLQSVLDELDAGEGEWEELTVRLSIIRDIRRKLAQGVYENYQARWRAVRDIYLDMKELNHGLSRWFARHGPFSSLLDIGTGTGSFLELAAPHVDQAIGIDLDRDLILLTRSQLERKRLKNCFALRADLFGFECHNRAAQPFTLVSLHHVLHYLPEPDRAISHARNFLSSGGFLLVIDLLPHKLSALEKDFGHIHAGFAQERLEGWLKDAGLKPYSFVAFEGHSGQLSAGFWVAETV